MSRNNTNWTVISFALSIAFWWLMLGSVEMALGFLALIFIHEMGHYIAAKHKGLTVNPPVFTPFGASVSHSMPDGAATEAYVSYAGPLFGTVGGVAALALGMVLDVPQLVTLARYAFLLNLFNMIPMKPLDGGGISMAIHRHLWVLGIVMLILMFTSFGLGNMFNMMILMLIGMSFFQDFQFRKTLPQSYFDVSFATRLGYGAAYLALGAFLYWAAANTQGLVLLLAKLGL